MNKKLYQRVVDIYSGAFGHQWTDEDVPTAEDLARIIPAIEDVFVPTNNYPLRFSKWNIAKFETPEMATDYIEEVIRWVDAEKNENVRSVA